MSDTRLWDPTRHEPLDGAPWDEAAVRAAIARIAARSLAECDPAQGWRLHPQDDPDHPGQCAWPLYHGAAGVVWALWHLVRQGALPAASAGFVAAAPGAPLRVAPQAPFAALVPALAERAGDALRAVAGHRHGTASLLLGEVGCWLLQWRLTGEPAWLDRIAAAVADNARNPCWEPLWGGSGTVLAAIALAVECPDDGRWARLVGDGVEALAEARVPDPETGMPIWQQDLYGRQRCLLGAGHGLAGNVFPALRAAAVLPDVRHAVQVSSRTRSWVPALLDGALQTLQALALHGTAPEGGAPLLNWHPVSDASLVAGRLPLVQDCHGAPGIVVRLAGAPRRPAWDALLQAAGELTWQAGPLTKGPGLCHGTAGNGFALLKLWRRTGDARWLQRARAFAMHAIGQVEAAHALHGHGRPSLWTGDPGVACYLWQCVTAGDRFPTLDVL